MEVVLTAHTGAAAQVGPHGSTDRDAPDGIVEAHRQ